MGILGGLIDSRITLGVSPMSPSQEAFIGQKKKVEINAQGSPRLAPDSLGLASRQPGAEL